MSEILASSAFSVGRAYKFPQTGVPGVRHSTFESLRLGRSSQSIASNLLAYWIP
ncbi:hypothetical protein YC2023_118836 [Brassica napus]